MLAFIRAQMKSFGHAVRGIRLLVQSERNAQIHLLASAVVIVLGLTFSISPEEWGLLVLATGLVWAAEAVNTAVERVIDLCNPEHHPIAGEAKDLAAGAVLLAAVAALVVGLILFLPRIGTLL